MNLSTKYDSIVIGAGLAGIACGIRLRKKGHRVLIIEKNDRVGGKLDAFSSHGYRWDNGPSLFTQPELVDELFELWGKNPRNYYQYTRQNESCRYHFVNQPPLIFKGTRNQIVQSLYEEINHSDRIKLSGYIKQSEKDYQHIGHFFLNRPQATFTDIFSHEYLKRYPFFLKKRMRTTLNKYNQQFNDPRLVQIFNRFGTYNGSNPYQMSGLYSMISSLEMNSGSFFPDKGMRSIPEALYQLAKEVGVEFEFNATPKAEKIVNGYSCRTSQYREITNLVCAIDHLTFYRHVLNDQTSFLNYAKQERSTSGLVFYWGINTKISDLGLHNILFSDDYEGEFKDLFGKQKCSQNPTFYIHVSSTVCRDDAPENGQNLFVMINTPAQQNPSEEYRNRMKEFVIDRIKKTFQVDLIDSIVVEQFWDNQTIESRTGSFQGALYGASSNSLTAALHRHPNKVRKHRNLYFCGGTVHPGGGIPLVLTSAKIVAESIS